jgi:hypothetical protein
MLLAPYGGLGLMAKLIRVLALHIEAVTDLTEVQASSQVS